MPGTPSVLHPGVAGLPLSGTDYNDNAFLVEQSFLDVAPYIISGLVPTIGTGLSVNVSSGTALIGAHLALASFVIGSLTPSATNYLFLHQDGTGTASTSSSVPAKAVTLGLCTTNGTNVTAVNTSRSSGRMAWVSPINYVHGGPAAGNPGSINLANWAAAPADSVTVYGVLPPGGGGGNMIGTGTVAARPAPSLAGTEYLPSDGVEVFRDTGAAWVPWGPIWPLVEPVNGSFAWINQGGASVDTTKGGIFLDAPAGAGSNLRIRKLAAPATPYTITAAFLPSMVADSTVFPGMGLLFRESSTSKLVTFSYTLSTTVFARPQKWTNETTFSAGYTPTWDAISNFRTGALVWLRVRDDGANLTFWLSNDNRKWFQTFTISRTDFMAGGPNEVGFWANANTALYDCSMWLLSWAAS